MAFKNLRALILLVAFASSHVAIAYDPSPLQDFCVADNTAQVFVNGFACKNPMQVTDQDFSFSGLHKHGDTNNRLGSKVTPATVAQIPGLNTLGISMVRIDFEPMGLNPPHSHPRGTEILTVLEGTLGVGFVTSNSANGTNRLISRVLRKGDVFVFPIGLIHFQMNIGETKAVAIGALSSQNPGTITVANALFGSDPPINANVLMKAFQLDRKVIDYLLKQF